MDGIDIRELKLQSLRSQFSLVSQDTILFNDTVFNNIAYGSLNNKVTKEDVKHTNKIDVAPEGLMSYEICSVYATNEYMETPEGTANIVSPKCLMLFKRSHLHRPLDFPKHIRHYHFLKSQIKDLDETYFSLLKFNLFAVLVKNSDMEKLLIL